MTTANASDKLRKTGGRFRMPDPPEREPDDMTSFDHLAANGTVYLLGEHLGDPATTIVSGEHYVAPELTQDLTGVPYPDLLVAFGVDPAAYRESNAYIIAEQGKPPDFVLEIASRSTGRDDVGKKWAAYEALGIPEYWRFDETGQYHRTRLAGDRLVNGRYQPITIETLPDGNLQGYSAVLNIHLRWEDGWLVLIDPNTGRRIVTLQDERARADEERRGRMQERARADAAEARVRELEEQMLRRNDGGNTPG